MLARNVINIASQHNDTRKRYNYKNDKNDINDINNINNINNVIKYNMLRLIKQQRLTDRGEHILIYKGCNPYLETTASIFSFQISLALRSLVVLGIKDRSPKLLLELPRDHIHCISTL